jgi:hypothetical protein
VHAVGVYAVELRHDDDRSVPGEHDLRRLHGAERMRILY